MSDKFDRYREALVVETATTWPPDIDDLEPKDRKRLEEALHAAAASCTKIEYVRLHTGFCRKITVTAEDVARSFRGGARHPDQAEYREALQRALGLARAATA